ncbi:hypothetical protein RJT34_23699 [Clitoria ternatea]|uniref:Uncharacterized protein n=1 Tax=Clitoria ternatea TaxID=43366 RepID=A0AAN9IHE7_CLITE
MVTAFPHGHLASLLSSSFDLVYLRLHLLLICHSAILKKQNDIDQIDRNVDINPGKTLRNSLGSTSQHMVPFMDQLLGVEAGFEFQHLLRL